jgi:23S rRNA pseudouridine2605 synthase
MEERLQKILSHAGFGARRACEDYITAGRVTVNGKLAILGQKADPLVDRILLDGQPIKPAEQLVYLALYKPRGYLSTVSAPDPRPTVRDLVELPGQLYPVGRLDVDSEGLILLTNDGELANHLTHPRYGHEKEYRVLVASRPDEEQLATWRRGVVLEDGYNTLPAQVDFMNGSGKGAWLRVVLREGRKRQIRETGQRLGLPVVKIIRVRIGSLLLGNLQPRQWRHLTAQEVAGLRIASPARSARKPLHTLAPGISSPPKAQPAPRPGGRPASRPAGERSSPRWQSGERSSEAGKPASRPGSRPASRPGGADRTGTSGPRPAPKRPRAPRK